MKKKNLMAALLTTLIAGHAAATPNWVAQTAMPDQSKWYIDTASIRAIDSSTVAVWMKLDLSAAGTAAAQAATGMANVGSQVFHVVAPCDGPTLVLDSSIIYSTDGRTLTSTAERSKMGMPPGSYYANLVEKTCRMKHML
jgi:hypothetical protein